MQNWSLRQEYVSFSSVLGHVVLEANELENMQNVNENEEKTRHQFFWTKQTQTFVLSPHAGINTTRSSPAWLHAHEHATEI